MSGTDFLRLLPSARPVTVNELAREQGVRPVRSLDDMRADLWESDEALDAFWADGVAARQENLA